MKVIQTETKDHAIKTFVAATLIDEARILVAILKEEKSLQPTTDEQIFTRVRMAYTSDRKEYIDIEDDVIPALPATLQKKVIEEKARYNERVAVETRKNTNKKTLVEFVTGERTVTEKDLPLLHELAEEAQKIEDDNVAYGGGWGGARKVCNVLPVTSI
jgi:hypothetical protein